MTTSCITCRYKKLKKKLFIFFIYDTGKDYQEQFLSINLLHQSVPFKKNNNEVKGSFYSTF